MGREMYKCFNCFCKVEKARYIFKGCPCCKSFGYIWSDTIEINLMNAVYEIYKKTDGTFRYEKNIRGLIFDLLPEYPKERNRLSVIVQNGLLERLSDNAYECQDYSRKVTLLKKDLRDNWGIEGADVDIIATASYVCGGICEEDKREFERIYTRFNRIMYIQKILSQRTFSQPLRASYIYYVNSAFSVKTLSGNAHMDGIKNCYRNELKKYRMLVRYLDDISNYPYTVNAIQYGLIEIELLVHLGDIYSAFNVAKECMAFSMVLERMLKEWIQDECEDDEESYQEYLNSITSIQEYCKKNEAGLRALVTCLENNVECEERIFFLLELNNAETAGAVCVECKSYTIRVDGNKVIQISNEINCTEVINTSLVDGCELSMDFLRQKKVRGMVYAIVDREGLLNHLRLTIRWKAKKIGYGDIYADEDISKLKNDLADMDVLPDKDRKIVELYRIVELFENVNREIICLYNSLDDYRKECQTTNGSNNEGYVG